MFDNRQTKAQIIEAATTMNQRVIEQALEINSLRARVAELKSMLKECADELSEEVEERYRLTKEHASMKRRYDRDIDTVVRARAVLAKGPSTSAQDEGAA